MKKNSLFVFVITLIMFITMISGTAIGQATDPNLSKTVVTVDTGIHDIKLHWAPVIGASGYTAYLKPASTPNWTNTINVTSTSTSFHNLTPGNYNVVVWAYSVNNGQTAFAR